MKKAISIVISVLLMMSALSLAAFAAEDDGMVPVVVKVPEGWDAPHAWAWADDGTNAFTSWPGEALTLDGSWYTIQVPGWINSVIINGNEGAVQTTDLSVETGKDVWIVVTDSENAAVSYEEPAAQPTAPEAAGSHTGLIIGIVAAVAVLGGGTAILLAKKKKK